VQLGADWLPCCGVPDAASAERLARQRVAASGSKAATVPPSQSATAVGPTLGNAPKQNINTQLKPHNTQQKTFKMLGDLILATI
jgi:hypothetical protein